MLAVVEQQVVVARAELGQCPGGDHVGVVVPGVGPDGHGPSGGEHRERIAPDAGVGFASAGDTGQVNDVAVPQVDAVMVRSARAASAEVVAAPELIALAGVAAGLRSK